MQLREAKAKLSEVVKSAEAGETVTITRHGLPVAKVVPIAEGAGQGPKKTFGEFLLEFPGPVEIDKDRRPPREIDL
jgi:prevent-host-death family protein